MKHVCTGTMSALCAILAVTLLTLAGTAAAQDGQPWSSDTTAAAAPSGSRIVPLFEVNNADIRSVFKLLSAFSGVDIVADEMVKGTVTLRVTNKDWKDILTIVCRALSLISVKEKNYLFVMTQAGYEKQQQDNLKNQAFADSSAPLYREIIQVSNTSAAQMSTAITPLLSKRGKITVAEHNNALIVFDTRENISQIRSVTKQLDVETPQISISCKMIQVSSGDLQEMGIHWGFFDADAGVNAQHLPQTNIIASALERLSYGIISPQRFSLALEYLFQDNKGEIIAQPSITTLDNKEASLFMGSQVPITFRDFAGNTVVQMVPAGTELTVTPHVTGEGRITLDLNPKKKSYTIKPGSQPVIEEQSARTNVVVNDGETVVIAGLTSNEVQKTEGGIPVLKDIPLIGFLFKTSKKTNDKKDLIIFVTPHIIGKSLDAVSDVKK